jgi:hypothetical protein
MGLVALKQPEKKAPSFGDVLKKAATAEPKKAKKPTMPTIVDAPPDVKVAVDEYQEAKATFKKAEATMNHNGDIIQDFVRQVQDTAAYAGRYHGSYAVQGNVHQVKAVYQNKYSINAEDEGELTTLLGPYFDSLITRKPSVKLKVEVFENEELQAELMELIGERFGDFFEATVSLGVCEDFSRLIYQHVQPEQMNMLRTFARQYKPSLR